MAAMRVNQVVWFWKDGEGRDRQPEPAIVTAVYGETSVDLWVFCQHGAQRTEKAVAVASDEPGGPLVRYATVKPAQEAAKGVGK